jgi:hypothetical protein
MKEIGLVNRTVEIDVVVCRMKKMTKRFSLPRGASTRMTEDVAHRNSSDVEAPSNIRDITRKMQREYPKE